MTLRIGIAGIRGRMGREIALLAADAPDVILVGGLGRQAGGNSTVFTDAADLLPEIDVLIDFTSPEAAVANAEACAALGKPLVRVKNVGGATILGDGTVVVLLNPNDLVRTAFGESIKSPELH